MPITQTGTQLAADAPVVVLERLVAAAEDYLTTGADPELEQLCRAVNLARRGVAEHDWGEWQEPYEAGDGEWFRYRVCQRCHEYVFERCDAPMEQDGAE